MITLHLEAETPVELIDNVKRMFNLVGYDPKFAAPASQEGPTPETFTGGAYTPAVPAEPAKRGRKPKAEKPEAPQNDGKGDAPAFLEETAEAEPEATIEDLRAAMGKAAEAVGTDGVFKVLNSFKDDKGEVVMKASQLQPADRAAAIAKLATLKKD